MEQCIEVKGREYQFATTYDGDSQYNVQVRSGDKLITMFKIAAETEEEAFPAAMAHFQSDIEMGNIQV
ncbi:hypothetical protein NDK47_12810 [Brevibacillus ruminantium]|uniref:Uncharacterized protein n=1 Tax=Brevibacillus ruminantium TaxID=2950604 RepID=A0ABY4WRQ1_9BACL|nr:hypothetical protein [Brevibacillus ruminantium]USG68104.1 hypothetical protein NDK47_12810 [Brevibacillus ruminantium]